MKGHKEETDSLNAITSAEQREDEKKVITRRGNTTSPIIRRKAKNKTEEVKQKYVTLAT